MKAERVAASKLLRGPTAGAVAGVDKKQLVDDVRARALRRQDLLLRAGDEPAPRRRRDARAGACSSGEIARIWKGGCIIRAQFLGRIKEAYDRNAELAEPARSTPSSRASSAERQARLAARVALGGAARACRCRRMTASLGYYDIYRRERLPANLTQAQRDFFGAHTYQRIDREGTFHTQWT